MTDTGCLRVGQRAPISRPPPWWTRVQGSHPSQYRGSMWCCSFIRSISPSFARLKSAFGLRRLLNKNTEVLGVSVDSRQPPGLGPNPCNQGGLGDINYPLVADLKKEISTAYNVLDEAEGVALRGLFIIDPDGVIMHATINNLPVGRNVDETLRVLQAFSTWSNPDEVCPANWTPGEKTMKPDPKGSKNTSQPSADPIDPAFGDPFSPARQTGGAFFMS